MRISMTSTIAQCKKKGGYMCRKREDDDPKWGVVEKKERIDDEKERKNERIG